MTVIPTPLNERFERNVIFKLARWLPLGLGGLATIGLVLTLIALLYAISPNFKPKEPAPIPTPSPVKLTQADVNDYMSPNKAKKSGAETTPDTSANAATS